MSNTPSFAEAIGAAIDSRVASVWVSLPGQVVAYDAVKQKCSVQPLIKQAYETEDGDRATETIPVIHDVPFLFPRSGGFGVTWPVTVGDTVLLVFTSSSLDIWLTRGGVVDPGDDRRGDLTDAVAIPGMFDFAHVPTDAPANSLVIHGSAVKLGSSAANDPVIRKSDLDAVISALNTHVHTGVTTGAGSSGPRLTPFANQPGSSVVKCP